MVVKVEGGAGGVAGVLDDDGAVELVVGDAEADPLFEAQVSQGAGGAGSDAVGEVRGDDEVCIGGGVEQVEAAEGFLEEAGVKVLSLDDGGGRGLNRGLNGGLDGGLDGRWGLGAHVGASL